MGDVLLVMLPALILAAVLWAVATALKPRNSGISEAERYQQELAVKSQAHYAAQVQAAIAARARVEAAIRPGQNPRPQPPPEEPRGRRKTSATGLPWEAAHSDPTTAKNHKDRL